MVKCTAPHYTLEYHGTTLLVKDDSILIYSSAPLGVRHHTFWGDDPFCAEPFQHIGEDAMRYTRFEFREPVNPRFSKD